MWLLAATFFLLVRAPLMAVASQVIPGAHLVEVESEFDLAAVRRAIAGEAAIRLEYNYTLFKGLSFQFNNAKTNEKIMGEISSMVAVKAVSPVKAVPPPPPPSLPDVDDMESEAEKNAPGAEKKVGLLRRAWCDWFGSCTNAVIASVNSCLSPYKPHCMTQVDKMHKWGITGSGIKIAVIDSGIDYKHRAFGGCFGKDCAVSECFGQGCVVSFGWDFVGDDYDGYNLPVPDKDPRDCGGHGTHVAGVIGARRNTLGFIGAAPGAKLGAYRVFGCNGSTSNDVLIAATYKAYEDGADIITSSVGTMGTDHDHPWATALIRVSDNGVPTFVTAGNDGANGPFFSNNAAGNTKVTSVGSFQNHVIPVFHVQGEYRQNQRQGIKFALAVGDPAGWGIKDWKIFAPNKDYEDWNDACNPLPDNYRDLSDKIMLLRRGNCPFSQAADNVAAKGAKYIIWYNFQDETFKVELPSNHPVYKKVTAVGMVTWKHGKEWTRMLREGIKVHLDVPHPYQKDGIKVINEKNDFAPGAPSWSSSWGPNAQLHLKPQFGAPGGNIISTYPIPKGGYAVLSGTSMACPFVAAVTALMFQVRGKVSPEIVTNLLSATAKPMLYYNSSISDFANRLAPVVKQGAGLIQAYDAAYTTTWLWPSSLSFNDTDNPVESLNFTVENKSKSTVSYVLNNEPAMSIYAFKEDGTTLEKTPGAAVEAFAKLDYFHHGNPIKKFELKGGQRHMITVKPTPPTVDDPNRLVLWGGYIKVNGSDKTNASIPYHGIVGSLAGAIARFNQPPAGSTSAKVGNARVVVYADGKQYTVPPDGAVVELPAPHNTAQKTDLKLGLAFKLPIGVSRVNVDVLPQGEVDEKLVTDVFGTKTIGQIRGSPLTEVRPGVNFHHWSGDLDGNRSFAPAGKYKLAVRIPKGNGAPKSKDDFVIEETQLFELKYKTGGPRHDFNFNFNFRTRRGVSD